MSNVKIKANASGTADFTIEAPATDSALTLTLPAETGSLLTNASDLPAANLTGTLPAIDGSNLTGITTGKVLQTLMGSRTSVLAVSTSTWTTICSVTITPSATSSKILVHGHANWGGGDDVTFRFLRGSTPIGVGDANGNRTQCTFAGGARHPYDMANGSGNWLDSPSTTSATTYYLQVHREGGGTCYVNRGPLDENHGHQELGSSAIIVSEISA